MEQIKGRKKEIKMFDSLLNSSKSEFLVVYGRRRVGKTFLIREYFNYQFDFQISGLANGNTIQQLQHFHLTLAETDNAVYDQIPTNWLEAFQRLKILLNKSTSPKKVIFFDEMPWLDTAKSDFIMALESFWNGWATNRRDIVLIACGSAASWIINELINNKGGLHNRVTMQMKIHPFSLKETEEFLISKRCILDRYQIAELYMAVGGLPYYLDFVKSGNSVAQTIENLFFLENAPLKNEYHNLYKSLFKKYEWHEKIIGALSKKLKGLNRNEIVQNSGLPSGGTFSRALRELEESGFITSYSSFENKSKNTFYRLSDFYTSFYFRFIVDAEFKGEGSWINRIDNPTHRTWQGYAFEQLCMAHIPQMKQSLGIGSVLSREASWQNEKAQIDLVIERRDHVVNLFEMKFSMAKYLITKDYSEKLRNKIHQFKESTKTKNAVFLTFVTTYGLEENSYSLGLVQNQLLLDDLFL
ncbi:MAG: ATP-binding protein [Arcicella sp.]|nr:ATP-binding protein [Arcicella sp.]